MLRLNIVYQIPKRYGPRIFRCVYRGEFPVTTEHFAALASVIRRKLKEDVAPSDVSYLSISIIGLVEPEGH